MSDLRQAAEEFLACGRIAVAGVSRDRRQPANVIYRRLRDSGHEVFAVNPRAQQVEGDPCFPDLGAIPGGVEAVVVATPVAAVPAVVEQCVTTGVRRVWMHRGLGPGSVHETAAGRCREAGLAVIPGACPMMFCPPVDLGHRCMRWLLGVAGRLPPDEAVG